MDSLFSLVNLNRANFSHISITSVKNKTKFKLETAAFPFEKRLIKNSEKVITIEPCITIF
jgi:hypothetical protein